MAAEPILVKDGAGGHLAVSASSGEDGFPLLFHSGSPGSRVLSARQVQVAVEYGFGLFSYDRPGFGFSDRRPGRRVIDGAQDVLKIADDLGWSRFATWGFSGGGAYALACAAAIPDRVVAACVLASVGPYGTPGLDFLDRRSEEERNEIALFFSDREAAQRAFRTDAARIISESSDPAAWMGRWRDGAGADEAHDLALAEHLAAVVQESGRQGPEGWWDDWVAYLTPWGFDVRDIAIAVQLWHGEQDQAAPVTHGRWLAAHIPNVDAHIVAHQDHTTLETDHQRTAFAWLQEQVSAS